MKKLILIFALLLSSLLFARDIYTGDLIKLQIKSTENTMSQEDIQKAFDPNIFYVITSYSIHYTKLYENSKKNSAIKNFSPT